MPAWRPAGRRIRTGGVELDRRLARLRDPSRRFHVAKRPTNPSSNGIHPVPSGTAARATGAPLARGQHGRHWGWDAPFATYTDLDLPTYVGPTTFSSLPWIEDPA